MLFVTKRHYASVLLQFSVLMVTSLTCV